jgi:hypothetical protein
MQHHLNILRRHEYIKPCYTGSYGYGTEYYSPTDKGISYVNNFLRNKPPLIPK